MNVDMKDHGNCNSGILLRTQRPIEKHEVKSATIAKTSARGKMMTGQVTPTPTGLAKKVITVTSHGQQNNKNNEPGTACSQEKHQLLAQLFVKHQQLKQQLLYLQQQAVAAQKQKIQSLVLQQLAATQHQECQPIPSFQHSMMTFAPTIGAAANTTYQHQTAFTSPAASLSLLQAMPVTQLTSMHGFVLAAPVIRTVPEAAHSLGLIQHQGHLSQAILAPNAVVVTPQRVASIAVAPQRVASTASATPGQDHPVLRPTRVSSAAISAAQQYIPKDKPLMRVVERKMPRGGVGMVRASVNIIEDDPDQEPGASCTKSSKGKRKRTDDKKSTSQTEKKVKGE